MIAAAPLVDAHAHLCDPAFAADLPEVLARARAAGVSHVVAVGETLADAERTLVLARQHPEVWPAAGLYPTHLDPAQADAVEAFIRRHRGELAAIGEVGLDRWAVQDEGDRELQREIFARFIDLSLELDLPLNVHSRSAGQRAVELLQHKGARRVLLHAFDARASAAAAAVEAGYFFSIPPSVLRSPQKQKLVKALPLAHLLLETDSPVLGPVPDQRNEPANTVLSLRAVAQLKGLAEAEVAEVVAANARRLFAR